MSTWLNFNLFGYVSHRKKTNQRGILDLQIIYDEALCDNIISGSHFALTKQLQLRWWRNRKAASVCCYLQFPWKNWNHGRGEKPGGLKHFTCWYLISFLRARENNLLLSLMRNGSSLIYRFAFWGFCKVIFESIALFWKYHNKLWGCPKPGNLSFRNNFDSQNCILNHQSRGN